MPEDTFQTDSLNRTSPRVSIRFVLCVLLGLYLVGYLTYRLNNEPPGYGWGFFRYSNITWSTCLRPLKHVWASDDSMAMKVFHTFYAPCYVAEEWLVYRVLT
jgi:hypothetical protein